MKIKTLVGISLITFWTFIFIIMIVGLLLQGKSNNQVIFGVPSGIKLTVQEIAKHNLSADCWLIINNKVYNVSGYLGSHPGGVNVVSPYCGKEASNAFITKGQSSGNNHSLSAYGLLANYLIGDINQVTDIGTISNTQNQPVPTNFDREDYD